jgi:hypothetical protein
MYLWENMPFFLVIGSLIGAFVMAGICPLEEGMVPLPYDNQRGFLLYTQQHPGLWRVAGGEIINYYASAAGTLPGESR